MRGFGHGHGRGGGRFFAHGGLKLVVLQLIADKPSHGYELIRAIEERVGGEYSPSPGVVYPTLTLLEEQGYITQTPQEGGRKLCTVTEAGQAFLAENRADADALMARMAGRTGHRGDGHHGKGDAQWRAPQVIRALENFKLAVRMRLTRAPLTPDEANAFAAILDGAAQQIERI